MSNQTGENTNNNGMRRIARSIFKRVQFNNLAVRERNTALLLDYLLEHPCPDCGESNPLVLEFDHVRGSKTKDISSMIQPKWSWKVIEAEISKCVVRCANCHRLKTAYEQNWRLVSLIEQSGSGSVTQW